MTPNSYQKQALKTENDYKMLERGISLYDPRANYILRLTQGLMGLNGESGEAIDILKKCLFQGHNLEGEREHLAKELGDVAWYLALSADAIGYKLEDILKMNIEKLNSRYDDGVFDAQKSLNRKAGDI